HHEKENINGAACYVLEGTSQYGKVTAWIAPEKGHNAMKWVIEKDSHHLFDDTPLSGKWPSVESSMCVFNLRELHEIEGQDGMVFVPKSAHFAHIISFRDGTRNVDHYKYETSGIQLNPDFEALGAFKIDLPEGIRVFNKDVPGLKFSWRNGGPVPDTDQTFLEASDNHIEQAKCEIRNKSVKTTTRRTYTFPDESADVEGASPDATEPPQKLIAQSARSRTWAFVLIAVFLVAAIVGVVLHRLKASKAY
ncbi:MAG: hypothetical protein ACYSU4_16740, partial [Planctomycetota bacterium]